MTPCILISDTQLANRRMLRFAMNLKGCEVIESADADEVLAIMRQQRVDLLLVSLYPHERDGYGVLEKLRDEYSPDRLPVILIGDMVLRSDFDPLLWCGRAWLDRPFRVSDLMSLVDDIVGQPEQGSESQSTK